MGELLHSSAELFFDPFAENGERFFKPAVAHKQLWERYRDNEIEHDYTVDNFVADTEALMLDSQFLGRFDEMAALAAQMHEYCGEDHILMQSSESLGDLMGTYQHDHVEHNHSSANKPKTKENKKKDKKKKHLGWFAWRNRE